MAFSPKSIPLRMRRYTRLANYPMGENKSRVKTWILPPHRILPRGSYVLSYQIIDLSCYQIKIDCFIITYIYLLRW